MIKFLLESLIDFPKGTLLILIALLNIFWVIHVVFTKKNYKQRIYKAYLFYAIFTLFWVISNAYFQSKLLVVLSQSFSKFMALFANITCYFAIIGFYYFSCLVRNRLNKISLFPWVFMIFLGIVGILFNVIPDMTVTGVDISPAGDFKLIFGPYNNLFYLIGTIAVIFGYINFFFAIRNAKMQLENVRLFYILFAMTLTYGAVFLFIGFFPTYYNNYQYVWVPPAVSIVDVLIVGYAIIVRRFLDIRLLASSLIKMSFSLATSLFITFLVMVRFGSLIFKQIDWYYFMIFGTPLAILLFNKTFKFLNSYNFYNYFGGTYAEHFRRIGKYLRSRKTIYPSVKECVNDLEKIFTEKNKQITPRIIVVDGIIRRKYPKLISYFRQNKGALVTEEIKFIEAQKDEIIPFLKELEALGGVCMPLYHPSKGLVALFVLGQKSYNHIYTNEEIQALEDIGAYLSFVITGIIYNSELEAEVSRKTTNLKNKIREIKELLRQQSDFIAVTAHEFRTPLSIALFQIEDILTNRDKFKQSPAIAENLKVIDEALDNLKVLTQKLFTVQRYDLNKVPLHKEKVDIKDFIKGIYQDFYILMKEKSLVFKLNQKLDKKTFLEIDKAQMRQVMQNLLTNAYKFTPDGGRVVLSTEKDGHNVIIKISDDGKGVPDNMKKTIFDKFRTNNNASGIGLGLYIAKKIVELHKGKIWAQDSEMDGAEFCVSLGD